MPSKSKAQARLMAAVAHNKDFAKKVGIPMTVGKEFNQADKGRKFKEGGMALFKGKESAGEEKAEARALRSGKISKAQYIAGEKSEGKKEPLSEIKKNASAIKSGKMSPAKYAAEEGKEYCVGGKVKKMASGGSARGCGCAVKGKTKGKVV